VSAALPPDFDPWLRTRCPGLPAEGARAVLALAAEGARAPFIARYRRGRTGGLGVADVRSVLEAKETWDRTLSRQRIILESIERHATLTPELRERILAAFDPDELEDLYLPFKPKKTRAAAAREAGLQPLADWIWDCGHGTQTPEPGQSLELWAFTFRDPERGIVDAKAALEGAREILVERLAETSELRRRVRRAYYEGGWLRATKTETAKPHSRYEAYFSFRERVASLREPGGAARYVSLRRGEAEGELRLFLGGGPDEAGFEQRLLGAFEAAALTVPDSPGAELLLQSARIALKGQVRSAIEGEVHHALREAADQAAAQAFAEGVRRRLLEPPFGPRPVLGVEPGPRGRAAAVVDASGAGVASAPFDIGSEDDRRRTLEALLDLVRAHAVEAVAVGDGASGREIEVMLRRGLKAASLGVPVVLVTAAGVAGWSTSDAAQSELPEREVPVRMAISIARRLQDPLAELVKVPPRALGAGHFPHDVAGPTLQRALEEAVETAVHAVGVNLNTASPALLAQVCGIGPGLASAIVEHRARNGPFPSRRALLEVPGLTAEIAGQAIGFLRVPGGEQPLDATGVHPERYAALEACAARLAKGLDELLGPGAEQVRQDAGVRQEVGVADLDDVVRELESEGRDPRGAFVPFAFRDDILKLEDLRPGMVCPGVISHVASFGAFVDVGVDHDGLVHVSRLGERASRGARERLRPGDRVQVRVVKVDVEKRQVSLALGTEAPVRKPAKRQPRPQAPPRPSRPRVSEGAAPSKAKTKADERRPRRPAVATVGPDRRPTAGAKPPPVGSRQPAFNNPFAVLASLRNPPKRQKS